MNLPPSAYVPVLISVAIALVLVPITWNLICPNWKRYGKVIFSLLIATVLAINFGWWSLIFVIGHPLIGLAVHIWWCRKCGLNWKSPDADEYRASQQAWVEGLQKRQTK